MARIRTIKPSFFNDLVIGGLPIPTRLTYVGLWTYVDDAGRGVDDARLIKAALWPLDDNYTTKKVAKDLELLAGVDRICRYEGDGKRCLHIVRWSKHQHINRPQPSLLDHCSFTAHSLNPQCEDTAHSPPDHDALTADSLLEGKGREGKGREGKKPPPADAVDAPESGLAPEDPNDPVHRQAHRLTVLAVEQPVKPLVRGKPNPFLPVFGLIERQLRAGTPVHQVEQAILGGVDVWTTAGLQTAIAKQRSTANGSREISLTALIDDMLTEHRELP